ncbi:MAG TPA: polysaccharide deacetylase family protein [Phycisphaerae bacterium]|nr:polysaccharide deacetylase family protein [Phycisphaerae bacterium]
MYHYVRPRAPSLPHFPYLSLSDFERQLDYFAETYGFVGRDEFEQWVGGGPVPRGVLLTFDDGLRDHIDFVLPVLSGRGLFGLFYVPSGPILTSGLLDVHKVHLAVGRLGGAAVLQWLETQVPEILPPVDTRNAATSHYAGQRSDDATKFVKHLFNWQLSAEERGAALDAVLEHAFAGATISWRDFYLDEDGVRALADAGMGVGPHSHRHGLLSRLSRKQEMEEIELSCTLLESFGGSRLWGYCYPYGSPEAFTGRTQQAVAKAGCPFAFAVAARDIEAPLARSARYALPRYNCNAFPHGLASFDEAT